MRKINGWDRLTALFTLVMLGLWVTCLVGLFLTQIPFFTCLGLSAVSGLFAYLCAHNAEGVDADRAARQPSLARQWEANAVTDEWYDAAFPMHTTQAVMETLSPEVRDMLRLAGQTCRAPSRRVQGHLWMPTVPALRAEGKLWKCRVCPSVCATTAAAASTGTFYDEEEKRRAIEAPKLTLADFGFRHQPHCDSDIMGSPGCICDYDRQVEVSTMALRRQLRIPR